MMEFAPFPKVPRLMRDITITEKIDGTNALVAIRRQGDAPVTDDDFRVQYNGEDWLLRFGSRTRWITPKNDNLGFARWALDNISGLVQLGEGFHYGEWWGSGIQRGYGLTGGEKRFSLFNVGRWANEGYIATERFDLPDGIEIAPACCRVVPILYRGPFSQDEIDGALDRLARYGSLSAPGYLNPEGIMIWHEAARKYFKLTIERDEERKGKRAA